jgi:hypothetical protein
VVEHLGQGIEQHLVGGDAWIDAEILGQVAERAPQFLRLGDDVDSSEVDGALGRRLQRGDGPRQRRLAGAVRTEEAVR